jgi:hypothetical protein
VWSTSFGGADRVAPGRHGGVAARGEKGVTEFTRWAHSWAARRVQHADGKGHGGKRSGGPEFCRFPPFPSCDENASGTGSLDSFHKDFDRWANCFPAGHHLRSLDTSPTADAFNADSWYSTYWRSLPLRRSMPAACARVSRSGRTVGDTTKRHSISNMQSAQPRAPQCALRTFYETVMDAEPEPPLYASVETIW